MIKMEPVDCANDNGESSIDGDRHMSDDNFIKSEPKDVQSDVDEEPDAAMDLGMDSFMVASGKDSFAQPSEYTVTQKSELKLSLKSFRNEKKHVCPVCQKGFKNKNSLTIHIRLHTGERPFHCSICTYTFADRSHLRRHMATHSDERPYPCEICGKAFKRKGERKRHYIKLHNYEPADDEEIDGSLNLSMSNLMEVNSAEEKPYQCNICLAAFSKKDYLRKHLKRVHLNKPLVLTVGNANNENMNDTLDTITKTNGVQSCVDESVDSAMDVSMENINENRDTGISGCDDMPNVDINQGIDVSINESIGSLKEAHGGVNKITSSVCKIRVKPFQCNICLTLFSKKEYLRKHMKRKHLSEPQKLVDEDKNIECVNSVNAVVTIKEEPKDVESDVDEEIDGAMNVSMGGMIEEKGAASDICNGEKYVHGAVTIKEEPKDVEPDIDEAIYGAMNINMIKEEPISFGYDENLLDSRISQNIGESILQNSVISEMVDHEHRHRCDLCPESFHLKVMLEQHLRTDHPYLKPYECDICGESFAARRQMNHHKETHRILEPIECTICNTVFKARKYLQAHMRRVHGKNQDYKLNYNIDSSKLIFKCPIVYSNGEQFFQCSICSGAFSKTEYLRKHYKRRHLNKNIEWTQGSANVKNETADVESSPNKSQTADEVLVKKEPREYDVDNLNESLDAIEEGAMKNSVGSLTETNGESIVLAFRVIPKEKPYHCNDCSISFSKKEYLRKHIRRKHRNDPCDWSYNANADTTTAVGQNLSEVFIKPEPEDEPYGVDEKNDVISNNMGNINEVDSLNVSIGDQSETNSESWKEETGESDSTIITSSLNTPEEETFQCKICSATFSQKGYLRKHLKRNHLHKSRAVTQPTLKVMKPRIPCDSCPLTFSGKRRLKEHQVTMHNVHKCELCPETFSGGLQLEMHKKKQHKQKHSCSHCTETFHLKAMLEQHLRTEHPHLRPYVCNICNAAFAVRRRLNQHKETHNPDRRFLCELCPAAFNRNSDLKLHIRKHSDERKYVCKICEKAFKFKSSLTIHTRLHTGERPYQCNICSYTFADHTHLRRHMKIHSDERPYACELCPKAFKRKEELKRHILTHTGEKPFPCTYCDKSFRTNSKLRKHLLTHVQDYCQGTEPTTLPTLADDLLTNILHCEIKQEVRVSNEGSLDIDQRDSIEHQENAEVNQKNLPVSFKEPEINQEDHAPNEGRLDGNKQGSVEDQEDAELYQKDLPVSFMEPEVNQENLDENQEDSEDNQEDIDLPVSFMNTEDILT